MCNLEQLSSKVCQFDGFTFYHSVEKPNYWCMHSHEEIQITLPQTHTRALIHSVAARSRHHTQKIKAGEALIIAPNQAHTLDWQHQAELTLFYLHPSFFARAVDESWSIKDFKLDRPFKISNDPIIKEVGIIFHQLCKFELETEKLYIESLANLLAVHLLKNYFQKEVNESAYSSGLSTGKFKLISEYIENNLSEKITLSDLAKVVNLGKFYFSHSFKKYTNMTPYDYVLQLRVKRAQQLLRSSNMPISNVALECGFGNQSHLTKHFRKKLGTTPMSYRKNV